MKTWDDLYKGIIIGLVVGLLLAALVRVFLTRAFNAQISQLQGELELIDNLATQRIDSLLNELKMAQNRVDTFYVEIIRWRTRYDTIYKEIPLLPAVEILHRFDSLTGDYISSVLSENDIALVPMTRVTNAYVRMLERDEFEGEIQILNKIISQKDGQITTLYGVITEKDGQIKVRDAWIETLGNDNKKLRQKLFFTRAGAIALLILLGVAAVN